MQVSKKPIPAPKKQCVEILERAVEIWKNPRRRVRGTWSTQNGAFCVLGAMSQAGAELNGMRHWFEYHDNDSHALDELAGLLGYPNADTAVEINDKGEGPDFLYERMKDALDRAVEAQLRCDKENADASKA
jgi:hypothetical protein